MPDIQYAKQVWSGMHISLDNGQGMGWTNTCNRFECQKWEGRELVKPLLAKNHKGFWCCPKCGSSYGRGPSA